MATTMQLIKVLRRVELTIQIAVAFFAFYRFNKYSHSFEIHFIDFSSVLLSNKVVKDYASFAAKIQNDFIYPDKITDTSYFEQVGAFPQITTIRDEKIKVIYYLQPELKNLLMNKASNSMVINRI